MAINLAARKLGLYRVDDQHDIFNHYSLAPATGSAGTFVSIVGSGLDLNKFGPQIISNFADIQGGPNAFSPLYASVNKVQPTASGAKPFGIALFDQLTADAWGYPFRWNQRERDGRECLISGEVMPIARKGYFLLNVGTGTPVSGGANPTYVSASDAGDGGYKFGTASVNGSGISSAPVNNVGYAVSTKDNNGFALFYVNCY